MARTSGPLMSMDASGTVGETVVFSKWKGRNYVRKYVVPHNPKSELQTGVRAGMKFVSKWASAEKTAVLAAYGSEAQSMKLSPTNAFVKKFMAAWRTNLIWPISNTGTPTRDTGSLGSCTAQAVPRSVNLTWTLGAGDTRIGYFIYSSTTTGFTPSLANCIGSVYGATSFSDINLPIGTARYYRIAGISSTSAYRLYSNEVTATPTA